MSDTHQTPAGRPRGLRDPGHGGDRRGGPPAAGSGDLPPKLERELDELFLAHSPVAGSRWRPGRRAAHGRRRHVHRPRGARRVRAGRRCRRQEGHAFAPALVRRVAHAPDEPVGLRRQPRPAHRGRPPAGRSSARWTASVCRPPDVVEFPALQHGDAWWVEPATAAVAKAPGRVLHAACGDGWLVRRIVEAGGDAYGVDPRAHVIDDGRTRARSTCAASRVAAHLRAVAAAGLGRHRAERHGRGHGRGRARPVARRRSGPGWPRAARSSSTP